jgi:hypothetical protein
MKLPAEDRLRWKRVTAIAVIVIAAIILALMWHRRVLAQGRAVTNLVRGGAVCLYDFEYDFGADEGVIPGYRRPSTPSPFLQFALGKDWLAAPVYVQLAGRHIGDRELSTLCESLAQLPTVRHLNLRGTHVSESGVAWLARLQQLAVLDVRDSAITPNGVKTIEASLPACHILSDADPKWELKRGSRNRESKPGRS